MIQWCSWSFLRGKKNNKTNYRNQSWGMNYLLVKKIYLHIQYIWIFKNMCSVFLKNQSTFFMFHFSISTMNGVATTLIYPNCQLVENVQISFSLVSNKHASCIFRSSSDNMRSSTVFYFGFIWTVKTVKIYQLHNRIQ